MNSRWVCRLKQRPWTLPLATSRAANGWWCRGGCSRCCHASRQSGPLRLMQASRRQGYYLVTGGTSHHTQARCADQVRRKAMAESTRGMNEAI